MILKEHPSRLIAKTPWAPPILIAVTSILTYMLGAYSLSIGWYTIFQNLLYIPIILACVFYITRGFIFSVILSVGYFLEMALFSSDPQILEGALVRVLIFVFVAAVVTYLTRLKCRSDYALRKSEEQLNLAIRGSGAGLWDWDISNGMMVINEHGAEILGYQINELHPLTMERWQGLANPDDLPPFLEALERHFDHTTPEFESEIRMRHHLGYWVWILVRGMVTQWDSSGHPTRVTGTYLDISRRKSLEIELEGQKRELENRVKERTKELSETVAKLKEEISERTKVELALRESERQYRIVNKKLALMNDITYQDIQNKVTAARGYLDMLSKKVDEEERLALYHKEDAILKTIHALISNTKNYQKIGMENFQWLDLETMIHNASVSFRSPRVTVITDLTNLSIYSDPMISMVFTHLIQNAVQHGKRITRVSFKWEKIPEGIKIICEDDGEGIPTEEKPEIFNRVTAGKGKFGLFFVQQFLSLSGMGIKENGEPGKGARFEITVPEGMYRIGS